jgi:hypothetical protein
VTDVFIACLRVSQVYLCLYLYLYFCETAETRANDDKIPAAAAVELLNEQGLLTSDPDIQIQIQIQNILVTQVKPATTPDELVR